MTPDQLAALHAACFTDRPRPWHSAEFQSLIQAPGSFLLTGSDAFLLGRAIGGEAELLTLAVAPTQRRQGIARTLVQEFASNAIENGAAAAFLEVASDNAPAQALYRGAGWRQVGLRPRYYGPQTDAIVMRLTLG